MAGKGGYQRPTSPAPVSGPGAKSQRTDGGPGGTQAARYISGLEYGQGQQMMATQQAAPMAGSASPAPSSGGNAAPVRTEANPVVPLNVASQRPNEPITHGADVGEGPGMASLGLGSQDQIADEAFKKSIASYLPVLMFVASRPNTSAETRRVIMQLRDQL